MTRINNRRPSNTKSKSPACRLEASIVRADSMQTLHHAKTGAFTTPMRHPQMPALRVNAIAKMACLLFCPSMMQQFVGKRQRLQALRRRLGPSLRVEPQATHRLKHHQASQACSGDAFSSNMSRRRLQTTHLQCMQIRHSHDGIEHKHLLYPGTLRVSLQLDW